MASSSAERRPPTAHRVALVAVAVLAAAGLVPALDPTSANYAGTATSAVNPISLRPECAWDGSVPNPYTSGLLDAAEPLLRWSFTDELPATATVHPADASAPVPAWAAGGRLDCDPADLSGAGQAGSLALTQGAVDSGLTAPRPALGTFTLLLWLSLGPDATGDLATVSGWTAGGVAADLVLSVPSVGTLQLATPDGAPVTAPVGTLAGGAAHLVAVTFVDGSVGLSLDGTDPVAAATAWTPEHGLDPTTLTVGARTPSASAGGLVDEVSLLGSAYDGAQLRALIAADRWWVPGPIVVTG